MIMSSIEYHLFRFILLLMSLLEVVGFYDMCYAAVKVCLVPYQISASELFLWLLPINYFCKKAPPEMFYRILNTTLSEVFI